MNINLQWLQEHRACPEGRAWFIHTCRAHGRDHNSDVPLELVTGWLRVAIAKASRAQRPISVWGLAGYLEWLCDTLAQEAKANKQLRWPEGLITADFAELEARVTTMPKGETPCE